MFVKKQLIPLLMMGSLTACVGGGVDSLGENLPPIANAGSDQSIEENTNVLLSGASSLDLGGTIASYSWSQTSGESVTLNDSETVSPSFTAPETDEELSLEFTLTVSDEDGDTATDTIVVTVSPVSEVEPNITPIANAGSDQTVNENSNVTLTGELSSDTDGSIVSYSWNHSSEVSLIDGDTAAPSFTSPETDEELSLEFILTVTDNVGATATDTVVVTVSPIIVENAAPTADAGSDQSVDENTSVDLNGSSSNDSDGSIVSYDWVQISGETVALADAESDSPSFTTPETDEELSLEFRLTVTDDAGATATDTVIITVSPVIENITPTADAGSDQSVDENTLVNLDGTSSNDEDGSLVTYDWTQTSGESIVLTGADTDSASFTSPETDEELALEFTLTVTDDAGATDTDTVVITVSPIAENVAPIADAGSDQSVDEETLVNLTGVSSIDEDGSIVAYSWTQTSGETVNLTGADTDSPSFTSPETDEEISLEFTLTVTDDKDATATDTVVITVSPVISIENESRTVVVEGDTYTISTIDNCGVGILDIETAATMDAGVAFNSLEDNMSGWYHDTQIDPDTINSERFRVPGITSRDDTCNDLNTHDVVMLKKYVDWNQQHVNGIEVEISDKNKTFGDIEKIVFEMKIDVEDSEIYTSEELKAIYGDLLTDEQYGFLDKGNTAFAVSIFNQRVSSDNEIVQTQRFIEVDQSIYGDEWIRVEIPFETMDIFTDQPWVRGYTTHEAQANTVADRIHINPEVLGTRSTNLGDVIRGLIGGPSDDEFLALNIQETYKEMSISIKRLEVHFK